MLYFLWTKLPFELVGVSSGTWGVRLFKLNDANWFSNSQSRDSCDCCLCDIKSADWLNRLRWGKLFEETLFEGVGELHDPMEKRFTFKSNTT